MGPRRRRVLPGGTARSPPAEPAARILGPEYASTDAVVQAEPELSLQTWTYASCRDRRTGCVSGLGNRRGSGLSRSTHGGLCPYLGRIPLSTGSKGPVTRQGRVVTEGYVSADPMTAVCADQRARRGRATTCALAPGPRSPSRASPGSSAPVPCHARRRGRTAAPGWWPRPAAASCSHPPPAAAAHQPTAVTRRAHQSKIHQTSHSSARRLNDKLSLSFNLRVRAAP
jgi:hypothetical protein